MHSHCLTTAKHPKLNANWLCQRIFHLYHHRDLTWESPNSKKTSHTLKALCKYFYVFAQHHYIHVFLNSISLSTSKEAIWCVTHSHQATIPHTSDNAYIKFLVIKRPYSSVRHFSARHTSMYMWFCDCACKPKAWKCEKNTLFCGYGH